MTTNEIGRLNVRHKKINDITRLTDAELIDAISRDDLRAACNEEANAAGWSLDTDPSDAMAAEYERRYNSPLPDDRSATWATFHCPPGFCWRVTASTRPNPQHHNASYEANRSATAEAATLPAARKAAEESLNKAICRQEDSGIREYATELVWCEA